VERLDAALRAPEIDRRDDRELADEVHHRD